jgi:LacI family transcriptional regulator
VGIEQQANAFGYSLYLHLIHDPDDPSVNSILNELVARRVDGIVWAVPEIANNRSWITPSALSQLPPIVFLSMQARSDLVSVAVDNRAGARLATGHLLERGRKRVALITGPLTWWEARERLAGWQESLREAHIEPAPSLLAEGNWSASSGQRAMEQLLTLSQFPDAVFCSNDQMALGALGVLHRAGLKVPDDVALVGFDNIPESEFFLPPLTTIYQQVIDIGRIAVQELLTLVEAERRGNNGHVPTAARLTPSLVLRASS